MTEAPGLTRREWVVLCLWISGATRGQIAESMGVSKETARTYVKRIQAKRDLRGWSDAMRMGADDDRPPVIDTPDVERGG